MHIKKKSCILFLTKVKDLTNKNNINNLNKYIVVIERSELYCKDLNGLRPPNLKKFF